MPKEQEILVQFLTETNRILVENGSTELRVFFLVVTSGHGLYSLI